MTQKYETVNNSAQDFNGGSQDISDSPKQVCKLCHKRSFWKW